MVDPISDAEREQTMLLAKIVLTLLVGASAGLITVQGDTSLEVVVGAIAVGTVVGAALAWYLFPDAEEVSPASNRRYER